MTAVNNLVRPRDRHFCDRTLKISELNDYLRQCGRGGMTLLTDGVIALGKDHVFAAYKAIADFCAFDDANDPHGEHDCAIVDVWGERVMFKIDCYDRTRTVASPDPSDPKLTVRVMSVMLASEY